MNQITLCGYLTKDFELIQNENSSIARNFIAITEVHKSKEGNTNTTKEYTDFIPIVLFGKKAEVASEYLCKGDKFLGSGKLRTSSYTDEGGQIRYTWQVIINHFEFVNGKKPNAQNINPKVEPKELNQSLPKTKEMEEKYIELQQNEEELPF